MAVISGATATIITYNINEEYVTMDGLAQWNENTPPITAYLYKQYPNLLKLRKIKKNNTSVTQYINTVQS